MQFLKNLLTSCLGALLAFGALIVGGLWIASSIGSSNKPKVAANSILKLSFSKPIPELSDNLDKDPMDFASLFDKSVGLHAHIALIEEAAKDANIKGIYMEFSSPQVGLSSAKKIRQALEKFKASGKFVIAYSTAFSQKGYYLASVSDQVYLHPLGGIDFLGLAGQLMYYKGLMDKVGIKAQIYYAGKFKSATEPFRRADMSPENRLQTATFLNGIYDLYLQAIATSRNVTEAELRNIANNALLRKAEDAVKFKMVDSLLYKDQVLSILRERCGLKADEDIPVVDISTYRELKADVLGKSKNSDNTIAIVYAEGGIVDGEGKNGQIGGDKYAREIREIRKDKNVKAIVLRINSGGGSALASDIIWREIEMAKAQGIHVVASMGDVAASGGYYIAANAHRIYAEDNTITGSIGVFGMIPNMRGLYETQLGLTMDTVKTGKFSTMSSDGGTYYEFNAEESALIQQSVDDIYLTFKKRVADGRTAAGRPMDIVLVDSFAQGRVWLGNTAQKIGLVDSLGGLQDAIIEAAKISNISEYNLAHYPAIKSFEESLFDFSGGDKKTYFQQLSTHIQTQYPQITSKEIQQVLRLVKEVQEMKGVQMRLPYDLRIE